MPGTEFNWIPSSSLHETASVIKEEATGAVVPLISPSETTPANTLYRRRSSTPLSTGTRLRPYPIHKQGSPPSEIDTIMSATPSSWSHSGPRGGRSHTPALRNYPGPSTDASFSQYMADSYGGHLADMRPRSSNSNLTSSLSGAIDESMPPHSRHSHSPPIRSDGLYAGEWAAAPTQISLEMQHQPAYPGVPAMRNIPYAAHDLPASMSYRNPSPDSNSSGSSTFTNAMFGANQYSLHRNQAPLSSRRDGTGFSQQPHHTTSSPNEERLKSEIIQLRRRVQDLEATERARNNTNPGAPDITASPGHGGLPTPPPSASFVASWKARTEIRRRMFCSLNRAGNALCAWHDSRRERREFPPRNAPPGYLNCGCTHEEALFEESLARHSVGSYYPGENVRMDPALRNPLLKLLQQRYGYQDGDFERNPITGDWVEGEGAAYWEQQAHSSSSSRRRLDTGH